MKFEIFIKIPYMGQLRTAAHFEKDVARLFQSDPEYNFLGNDVSVNGRLPITCSEVVDLTPDEFKERKAILDSLFKLTAFGERPLKVVKQFEYEDENLKRIYFHFNPGENVVYSPAIIRIYRTE